jgi:ketosteroid isomerase-like protein
MTSKMTVLFLALATLVSAPKSSSAQQSAPAAKALTSAEEKWVDALQKSDAGALDSILADSYGETDEQGHRSDKQAVLSALKSGDLKLSSIKLSDMEVHTYGDAAVVTGSASQAGTFKGEPLPSSVVFTDTFIKQNGKWRAVASHRSVTQATASH